MSRLTAQWISAATALAFALVIGAVILRPILSAEGTTSPDDPPATIESVSTQFAEGNIIADDNLVDDESYEDDDGHDEGDDNGEHEDDD